MHSTNQWERHFPVSSNGAIALCTNMANAAAIAKVEDNLSEIKRRLSEALHIDETRIVPVPVLFSPSLEMEDRIEWKSHALIPNMVNLISIVSSLGPRRILVPDPAFKPYREYMRSILLEMGYGSDDVLFVNTDELHPHYGEAHCGSNVQRIRIL